MYSLSQNMLEEHSGPGEIVSEYMPEFLLKCVVVFVIPNNKWMTADMYADYS